MQPFGTPVLPEVYRRTAGSSCAVGVHSRSEGPFCNSWIFTQDSELRPVLSNSSHRSVSEITSIGSALSMIALISRCRSSGAVGTATAPIRINARNAVTKCGRFNSRMTTQSPGLTPRCRSAPASFITSAASWSYVMTESAK